jgi:hypothetical protein
VLLVTVVLTEHFTETVSLPVDIKKSPENATKAPTDFVKVPESMPGVLDNKKFCPTQ